MDTLDWVSIEVERRRGSRTAVWQVAGYAVGALSLVGLTSQGTWLLDACILSDSSGCWIGRPVPAHEASLASVGAVAGVTSVWAVAAGMRGRWRAVVGLVLAVGLAGVGRWWAGPQTPFSDAWLTDHHPLLVWFGIAAGVGAASVTWAWWHRRSTVWAAAAAFTAGFLGLTLIGLTFGVSSLE